MIKLIESCGNQGANYVNHWFEVDGVSWGLSICDDSKYSIDNFEVGKITLLNCDGCPVEPINDHDNVKHALIDHMTN